MTVDGDLLTITVDLSKEFGPSSSGKTIIIASTEGNVTIPEREEKIGLNVYRTEEVTQAHPVRGVPGARRGTRVQAKFAGCCRY